MNEKGPEEEEIGGRAEAQVIAKIEVGRGKGLAEFFSVVALARKGGD